MKIRHFEDRLADIGDRVRPGRLLDVGCSCGYFMEVAAARGFDVQGVEFYARRDCGRQCRASGLASSRARWRAMPDNGLFDVVSAFDLIEHVPDPAGFLRRCARFAQAREARS